jgi:hypothetical protein
MLEWLRLYNRQQTALDCLPALHLHCCWAAAHCMHQAMKAQGLQFLDGAAPAAAAVQSPVDQAALDALLPLHPPLLQALLLLQLRQGAQAPPLCPWHPPVWLASL